MLAVQLKFRNVSHQTFRQNDAAILNAASQHFIGAFNTTNMNTSRMAPASKLRTKFLIRTIKCNVNLCVVFFRRAGCRQNDADDDDDDGLA